MAGLKAANIAPTWPSINGSAIPSSIFTQGSFLNDAVHNKLTVHFIHRSLAYIIFVTIIIWWWRARNITYSKPFNRAKNTVFILVLLQLTLGVLTVTSSPKIVMGRFGIFEWLALSHQLTGMLLLLTTVSVLYITRYTNKLKM